MLLTGSEEIFILLFLTVEINTYISHDLVNKYHQQKCFSA